MAAISFTSRLEPRDVMWVAVRLLLRHSLSVMALASGPVFLLVGLSGGSPQVTELGRALSWLLLALPAFAFLVGTFNAYRPGSGRLYEPVEWSFADEGIETAHPGRRAHVEWSEFRSWRVSAGCYLLDIARRRYLAIPQRDVPQQMRSELEALLAEHLGAKRR